MSEDGKQIKEGYEKKGGQNQKPSQPRPSTPPAGQKPEQKPAKK